MSRLSQSGRRSFENSRLSQSQGNEEDMPIDQKIVHLVESKSDVRSAMITTSQGIL